MDVLLDTNGDGLIDGADYSQMPKELVEWLDAHPADGHISKAEVPRDAREIGARYARDKCVR